MENTNVNLFEMIAARALHFMRINCNMEYVDIAAELGIDVQEVLDLIGPGSYDDEDAFDDSDMVLEVVEEAYDSAAAEIAEAEKNTDDLKESYRRTVSRGATLVENELFVDFD